MEDVILQVNHLSKSFGSHEVLRDIDFTVAKGDVTSIIGASGSGKSTLLRCINLLETPSSGEILYHGKNVAGRGVNQPEYRSHVGMVFQSFNLFNNMTVLENCMVGQIKVLKRGKAEAREAAMTYLTKVGMAPYINAKPRQISGGQKQRVAIAGIIAMMPRCIVLDEATAMLDPQGRKEIIDVVTRLHEQKNITVVMITQYMEEAIGADRVAVMSGGELILEGAPKEVFAQDELLHRHRLDVPTMQQLANRLNRAGAGLPRNILSVEEMAQAICLSLSKN